jgi:hypothetical protein
MGKRLPRGPPGRIGSWSVSFSVALPCIDEFAAGFGFQHYCPDDLNRMSSDLSGSLPTYPLFDNLLQGPRWCRSS